MTKSTNRRLPIPTIIIFGLLLTMALIMMLPTGSYAETSTQDGLIIDLTTDEPKYITGDTVKVTFTITNTNPFAVTNIDLQHIMPAGFTLSKGSETNTILSLGSEESETFRLEYVSQALAPGGSPDTGDTALSSRLLIILILFSGVFFVVLSRLPIYKVKSNRHTKSASLFSLIIGITLFSTFAVTVLPATQSFADTSRNSFPVSSTFLFDGKEYTHSLEVTYDFGDYQQEPITGLASTDLPLIYGESKDVVLSGGSGLGSYTLTSIDPDIVITGPSGTNKDTFTVTNYNPRNTTYALIAGKTGDMPYADATPVIQNSGLTAVKPLTLVAKDWKGNGGSTTDFDYVIDGNAKAPTATVDSGITTVPGSQPKGVLTLSISGAETNVGSYTATASLSATLQEYFNISGATTHNFNIINENVFVVQFDDFGTANIYNQWQGAEVSYSLYSSSGDNKATGILPDADDTPTTITVNTDDILTLTEVIPNRSFRDWRGNNKPLVETVFAHVISMPKMNAFTTNTTGTKAGDQFFSAFNRDGSLTSFPDNSFDISGIATTGFSFFDRFNYNGSLTSLPVGSFNTSGITTTGYSFFDNFNYNGSLTSLPVGSFNISKITTAGSSFFAGFNWYGDLTSLPVGSFDTSGITGTVGNSFFANFNWNGDLTTLPVGSFNISKITATESNFFEAFNTNGSLVSLPFGSFNISKITTVGGSFFHVFNSGGSLTSLPVGSFDTSGITGTVGDSFFYAFNDYGHLQKVGGGNPTNKSSSTIIAFYYLGSPDEQIVNGAKMEYAPIS